MRTNDLKEKWDAFRSQEGFLQRIDACHPMNLFIGISEKGYDEMVMITDAEPADIKSSKALEIEKGKRKDGRWATQIMSVDKDNQDVFARLCLDILESSENASNEAEGIRVITKRFLAWQKLFASMNNDLSKSVLKGLFGEMRFARDVLSPRYTWDEIMIAWEGPEGADRDYRFGDCWYELKAVDSGKPQVSISSLEQLDCDNNGYLVKYNVDETNEMDPDGQTISSAVNEMRELLSASPSASQMFERKLVSVGYIDRKSYESIAFACNGPVYYLVDENFPKLIRSAVAKEIASAKYELSLAGIEPWRREGDEVWR